MNGAAQQLTGAPWYGGVSQAFAAYGVTAPEWGAIAQAESGLNPSASAVDSNGYPSVGLFQENQAPGNPGAGYSSAQLQDPVFNATVAAKTIGPAAQAGRAMGLSGSSLEAFIADHSGHPVSLPMAQTTLAGSGLTPSAVKDARSERATILKDYTALGGGAGSGTGSTLASQLENLSAPNLTGPFGMNLNWLKTLGLAGVGLLFVVLGIVAYMVASKNGVLEALGGSLQNAGAGMWGRATARQEVAAGGDVGDAAE
ncbi:MAG: transglycosylase SLT domain-containing protein, partial [Acidobacteriaceae bacterium]